MRKILQKQQSCYLCGQPFEDDEYWEKTKYIADRGKPNSIIGRTENKAKASKDMRKLLNWKNKLTKFTHHLYKPENRIKVRDHDHLIDGNNYLGSVSFSL